MDCLSPLPDWQAPWWQPWRDPGHSVLERIRAGEAVHQALNQAADRLDGAVPVRFVAQTALPLGQAYEAYVFETGCVPTRDNLHDFFNGLAWLRFPQTKRQLNALQHAQIRAHGVQALRGPVRDALTLFDENAAFLSIGRHQAVLAALRQRDWHAVFQAQRELLARHPPVLFGHALLEKLVSPYKSITAHVFPIEFAPDFEANGMPPGLWLAMDEAVAHQLATQSWTPKPFVPLPVLGVPLWWAANEAADFYADHEVFRPPRS